jgi:hypothetical protein
MLIVAASSSKVRASALHPTHIHNVIRTQFTSRLVQMIARGFLPASIRATPSIPGRIHSGRSSSTTRTLNTFRSPTSRATGSTRSTVNASR